MPGDLTDQKFGNLYVIGPTDKRVRGYVLWECRCDCGEVCLVPTVQLRRGKVRSCGCILKAAQKVRGKKVGRLNKRHGHVLKNNPSQEYNAWHSMKTRCYNINRKEYKNYGARGIFVCRRWRNSFENFLEDMGSKPEGLTLDRINNNGSYGKWNCRWATYTIQANNRRLPNV